MLSWLARLGIGLVLAKVALVPIVLDPLGDDVFALPKTAVSRAITYLLVAALVAFVVRYPRGLPRHVLWLPLGAYVAIAALATILAVHVTTSLYGTPRRFLGLTAILDGAVLALACATFIRGRRDLRLVLGALFGGAAVVLGYGLLQIVGRDLVRWTADHVISSTIGNTGAFAGYVAIVTSAAVFVALADATCGARLRLALLGLAATGTAEILIAGARSPTFALVIGLVAAITLAWRLGWRVAIGALDRRLLAGAGLTLLALVLLIPFTPAATRLARLVAGGDTSLGERAIIYDAALRGIASRPALGVGPDGFVTTYLLVRAPESAKFPGASPAQSSTHSWPLHHAFGTGLAGFAAIGVLSLAALVTVWRRAGRPDGVGAALAGVILVAYLAQGVFNINHVGTEWFFWLAIGVAAAPSQEATENSTARRDAHRPRKAFQDAWPTLAAVALGSAVALTVLNSLAANRAVATSNVARRAGSTTLAVDAARAAIARDPNRAEHWSMLGLALSASSPEQAAAAFRSASERALYDPVYPLNVASEELRVFERTRSERAKSESLEFVKRALALDPYSPEVHLWYGRILLTTGSPAEAIPAVDRGIAFARSGDTLVLRGHAIAAEAFLALGRVDAAEARLRTAVQTAQTHGDSLELQLRTDLARLLLDAGRLEEARAEAELVRGRQPENAPALAILRQLAERR